MELTQKESAVFDLLSKKSESGGEFSDKEGQAFNLLAQKNLVEDIVTDLEGGIVDRAINRIEPVDKEEKVVADVTNFAPEGAFSEGEEGEEGKDPMDTAPGGAFPEVNLNQESVLNPVGRETKNVAIDTGMKSLTALGAPIMIPLHFIDGLRKDFTGGSSTENLNSIRRILALDTKHKDHIFIGDVLKNFGLTDEKFDLPEGTIDRIGFTGDILAFNELGHLSRFITRHLFGTVKKAEDTIRVIASAKDPAKAFTSLLDDMIASSKEEVVALTENLKTEIKRPFGVNIGKQESLELGGGIEAKVASEAIPGGVPGAGLEIGGSGIEADGGYFLAPNFYSRLKVVVDSNKIQEKGTGEQLLNQIKKGVKKEEIYWSGLDDFLKGKSKVTKKEIQDFLRMNEIVIEETRMGGISPEKLREMEAVRSGLVSQIHSGVTGEERSMLFEELRKIDVSIKKANNVKFGPDDYPTLNLPGGEGYTELLLRLSNKKPFVESFQSTHYPEPDILAHVRFNERTTTNSERVLFIEELQSDWMQAGRKEGFRANLDLRKIEKEIHQLRTKGTKSDLTRQEVERLQELRTLEQFETSGVPNAPLLKNWETLVMKRILREASEKGFDRVAWINGKETAARYDLSKVAKKIIFTQGIAPFKFEAGDSVIMDIILKNGSRTTKRVADHAELEAQVGKGIARKVKEGFKTDLHVTLEGEGLRVGGHWAFNLYDKKIKNIVNEICNKKWGVKVDEVGISMDRGITKQFQSIKITDSMRKSVIEESQELFSGINPFTIAKPFLEEGKLGSLGVQMKELIEERVFNIRKATLASEKFRVAIKAELTPLEREALTFIREGFGLEIQKAPPVAKLTLDKIGKGHLFEMIKNPSLKLQKWDRKLAQYYSDQYKFLAQNYDAVGFVEHYVTHVWDIPKNRAKEVLNYFGTKNPFVKKRKIVTIADGIKLGLKPKTLDIDELIYIYDNYRINTVFNKRFADGLNAMVDAETGLKAIVKEGTKNAADYKKVNHPAINRAIFKGKTTEGGIIIAEGNAMVHPDIVEAVNNVFSTRIKTDKPILREALWGLETINAWSKKLQLSFSFFHHFALTESAFSSGIGIKAIKLWNPFRVYRALKNNDFDIYKRMSLAFDAIENGRVTFGPLSDFQIARVQQGFKSLERATKKIPGINKATKTIRVANELWDKALWDYMHNTLKLDAYYRQTTVALKQGNKITQKQFGRNMNAAEIKETKRQIGLLINDSFGGQNWEIQRLMGNKKFQQISQWFLLSPDWTISTIKQGIAPFKGKMLRDAGGTQSVRLAGQLLEKRAYSFWIRAGMYYLTITNAINIHNSVKHGLGPRFTWQNDPGHELDVFLGYNEEEDGSDGTKRYIRFGKQFRENMEWIIKPLEKLGGKLSPVAAEIFRQTGKTNPGSGFPTKFKDMGFWDEGNFSERFKSIITNGVPFSLRHLVSDSTKNLLYTFPTSRGMSNHKTIKRFKNAIKDNLDLDEIERVHVAALENHLDAESLWKSALNSVKAEKTYNDKAIARKMLKEFDSIEGKGLGNDEIGALYNYYKENGIITEAVERQMVKLLKKRASVAKQREEIGLTNK